MTSTSRPSRYFSGKPPVPTLALWGRRDGIVAPSAARGLANEVDKAVEIDTHHMGFAVYRPALSRVVAEIRTFLTEMEGKPPELHADGGGDAACGRARRRVLIPALSRVAPLTLLPDSGYKNKSRT